MLIGEFVFLRCDWWRHPSAFIGPIFQAPFQPGRVGQNLGLANFIPLQISYQFTLRFFVWPQVEPGNLDTQDCPIDYISLARWLADLYASIAITGEVSRLPILVTHVWARLGKTYTYCSFHNSSSYTQVTTKLEKKHINFSFVYHGFTHNSRWQVICLSWMSERWLQKPRCCQGSFWVQRPQTCLQSMRQIFWECNGVA